MHLFQLQLAERHCFCVCLEGRPLTQAREQLNMLRNVLNGHKEIIARPAITLIPTIFYLFSLPFVVTSFSLACHSIETSQLRYLSLTCYFMSFIPQTMTFFLYIYPSSFYFEEWQATAIGERMAAFRIAKLPSAKTNLSRLKTPTAQD